MRRLGWFLNEHDMWQARPWLVWVLRRVFGLGVIPAVSRRGAAVEHKADASDEPMTWQEGYFGVCPQCRRHDGYANVGKSQYFFCKKHRVKWCIGANVFSSWRDQTEAEQRRIYDEIGLGEFEKIEPLGVDIPPEFCGRPEEAPFSEEAPF
jgi:hypothetical protein